MQPFYNRIVLTCFEDLIGLKENLSKSEVVLVGEVGTSCFVLGDQFKHHLMNWSPICSHFLIGA